MAATSTKVKERQDPAELQLTAQQEQVIALLLAGQTQAAAAGQVGIAPETVTRWKSGDAVFMAAYNEQRRDMWESSREKLTGLRDRAVDTVAGLLDSEHEPTRLKAALSVLDMTEVHPGGPTDAAGVERLWEKQERDRRASETMDALLDMYAGPAK